MAKITVFLTDGTQVVLHSDAWRKEWPNTLIVDYLDKKDPQGRPLIYGQFVGNWDGFLVEYD